MDFVLKFLFDAKKPFAYSLNFRYFCGYALTLGQCVRVIRKRFV